MNGISIRYGFVRSRQLEGTFPGEKETGNWPITWLRVGYGWGFPPEECWPDGDDWPPREPPDIDLVAKRYRLFWPYRRVRTIAQCKEAAGDGVMVSLDITDKWAHPWRGVIPAPSSKDIRLPRMHSVLLVGSILRVTNSNLGILGDLCGETQGMGTSQLNDWKQFGGRAGVKFRLRSGRRHHHKNFPI
jgi:hypothetical protein